MLPATRFSTSLVSFLKSVHLPRGHGVIKVSGATV